MLTTRVISSRDLICYLLPECEALRTSRSEFPIATSNCAQCVIDHSFLVHRTEANGAKFILCDEVESNLTSAVCCSIGKFGSECLALWHVWWFFPFVFSFGGDILLLTFNILYVICELVFLIWHISKFFVSRRGHLWQNHRNVFSGSVFWEEKSKFVNNILKSDFVFSCFAWTWRLHALGNGGRVGICASISISHLHQAKVIDVGW